MPTVLRDPRRRAALAVLLTGAIVAGCAGASSATTPGVTAGGPASSPTVPAAGQSGSSTGSSLVSPMSSPPAPSGGSTTRIPIDPTLLAILPSAVGGLPVQAVPDPAGADDPQLEGTVDRMAQAIVVDPASQEFAYASVIALRPGVFGDAFYRSWRDSFDEGACSQAGGVTGHAEATIGDRPVFIGRCSGGVLTYHVRLDDRDAIVSISSFGAGRLGEQLVGELRP